MFFISVVNSGIPNYSSPSILIDCISFKTSDSNISVRSMIYCVISYAEIDPDPSASKSLKHLIIYRFSKQSAALTLATKNSEKVKKPLLSSSIKAIILSISNTVIYFMPQFQ